MKKLILLCVLLMGLFSACVVKEEILKVESPDKKVDALLVRFNSGACSGYSWHIFLVPHGTDWKNEKPMLSAERAENISLAWENNNLLEISFDRANISHFSNFWYAQEVDNFQHVVELRIKYKGSGTALSF